MNNNLFFAQLLTIPEEDTKNLLEQLWDFFVHYYLESNTAYENLGFGSNSMITLPTILVGIFVGVILSSVLVVYEKRVIGGFVRKMLSENAVGRKNAKTLYHLGYNACSTVGSALRRGVGLRKIVRCVEEEEHYKELEKTREEYEKRRAEEKELPEFKTVDYTFGESEHFYIPEDKKYTAEVKFAKGGASWLIIPVIIVASIVGFFVLMLVLPHMLTLIDQAIGSFGSV